MTTPTALHAYAARNPRTIGIMVVRPVD